MSVDKIIINVDDLVYIIARSGDIDNGFRRNKNIDIGKVRERIMFDYGSKYTPNVSLSCTINCSNYAIELVGTADGVIKDEGNIIIDGLILTNKQLKDIDGSYDRMGYAKILCNTYIYASQNGIEVITSQQTYCNRSTLNMRYIKNVHTLDELGLYVWSLIGKYMEYQKLLSDWSQKRDASIKELKFPFKSYRSGQRELAEAVYRTIANSKNLFAQAPTGVGKTVSTIFPAVKAIGERCISKIFYATAKTITRQVAEESLDIMRSQGLKLKSLTLTAKEKMCFNDDMICTPEHCRYACGHYDRVGEAILSIYKEKESFTREGIEEYARRYQVCPFEFALDLSLLADCIICDYNYIFDPQAYLRRYFDNVKEPYAFLIDEAHNLVDRSRDMFSAQLDTKNLVEVIEMLGEKDNRLVESVKKLYFELKNQWQICERTKVYEIKEEPASICLALSDIMDMAETWLTSHNASQAGYRQILDLYFDANEFTQKCENYSLGYTTYLEKDELSTNISFRLMCVDTSVLMSEAISRGKSAVMFSATLEPLDYYAELLGGKADDNKISIQSPFDPFNLKLIIHSGISTKYDSRESSYELIVESIKALIDTKTGNYLVFFPSYKYMNGVYNLFTSKYNNINTIKQEPNMSEQERERFIEQFKPDLQETLVGFALLGGIFSEGIDLKGDKLVGSVIVGVGLPQICAERDIIKEYFNKKNGKGYDYAYTYPGMNKVLQAGGRVIRSDGDRGIILLLDERFNWQKYRRLFPSHWINCEVYSSILDIKTSCISFWDKQSRILRNGY